ncbi:MAG: hypothetical protein ACJAUQ_000518 [Maribacter sp.]|jgi:hypothetical protein
MVSNVVTKPYGRKQISEYANKLKVTKAHKTLRYGHWEAITL